MNGDSKKFSTKQNNRTHNNAYILLLGSSLLTKVLADFLFGFYLLT